MAVELDLAQPDHLAVLVDFGPYSIHSERIDKIDGEPPLVLHDSGSSVTVRCDGPDADQVRDLLANYGATYRSF